MGKGQEPGALAQHSTKVSLFNSNSSWKMPGRQEGVTSCETGSGEKHTGSGKECWGTIFQSKQGACGLIESLIFSTVRS